MLRLRTLMGNHPHAAPLKKGDVRSDLVALDFADEPVPHEAFKPFVRDNAFDCGELAIVTILQAREYAKDIALLPAVISARFHQGSIGYNVSRGELAPKGLEGRTVAVRTYAQTTGVWVRGALTHQFGVDCSKVNFLTFDEAHLAEYRDPPNCRPAPKGAKLDAMLLAGEVDAGIPIALASNLMKDERIRTVIPDPEAAARDWHARFGAAPINHMLVVRKSVLEAHPRETRAVYEMFAEGKRRMAPQAGDIDFLPFGVEATRRALEVVIDLAYEQKIISRRFEVDELYEDARRVLEGKPG